MQMDYHTHFPPCELLDELCAIDEERESGREDNDLGNLADRQKDVIEYVIDLLDDGAFFSEDLVDETPDIIPIRIFRQHEISGIMVLRLVGDVHEDTHHTAQAMEMANKGNSFGAVAPLLFKEPNTAQTAIPIKATSVMARMATSARM